MIAVIYHADAQKQFSGAPTSYYKPLFEGFVKEATKRGIKTVHCTLEGFPCWGDEAFYTAGLDPEQVVYNREVCFTRFLEQADPNETYLFTEPDARLRDPIPPLDDADCAMLYRRDPVPMTPSFRLATVKALPLFVELRDRVHVKFKSWDGDSWACASIHKDMGSPEAGQRAVFKGVRMEMRPYDEYNKLNGKYIHHYKFRRKQDLWEAERGGR